MTKYLYNLTTSFVLPSAEAAALTWVKPHTAIIQCIEEQRRVDPETAKFWSWHLKIILKNHSNIADFSNKYGLLIDCILSQSNPEKFTAGMSMGEESPAGQILC